MCGVPFSRGIGTFVRPAMKMLSEYSQNTLRVLSEYSQMAVRGAGLKLQCSPGGPHATQWGEGNSVGGGARPARPQTAELELGWV